MFLLTPLLRCERDLLPWASPLCQAGDDDNDDDDDDDNNDDEDNNNNDDDDDDVGVRLRDARPGDAHIPLQPHHHPRPFKVYNYNIHTEASSIKQDYMKRKIKLKL